MQTIQKKKECPKRAFRVVYNKEERKEISVQEAEVRTQRLNFILCMSIEDIK